ncbi:MAG TPA: hypothetical protein VFS40_07310 [Gemmatimonadales bacterium]|nr:hypothetical protein [Gemmatimonadales bacterium]
MQFMTRTRGSVLAGLVVLALAALVPAVAGAKPQPGAQPRHGFRLFARPLGALTGNRIYCGLSATGEVCVDSTNSSTIGGGFWPKGTGDQYIFNSGLQVAGIIGPDGGPWAGDTTGMFLFDPKGNQAHGEQVQPIFNAANQDDLSNWPAAANIPQGDAVADLFAPALQGQKTASASDVWWLTWDGNPANNNGRPHPLGIMVEQRGMAFNAPRGNEDIIYFIYTFYNITSSDPAAYAAIRPAMRDIAIQQGQKYHQLNPVVPPNGYTITNMFAAFAADNDVTGEDSGNNYSSVNLPFALGYSYHKSFAGNAAFPGWQFDPSIFSGNQFAGTGFIGVKYLKSPTGPGEIQLFGVTQNGGAFNDPQNVVQLDRYLSGQLGPQDQPCNVAGGAAAHICYVAQTPSDTRFFQSSTPLTLKPGEFGTIVVAYIFAAPTSTPGFIGGPGVDLPPGNPHVNDNVATLTAGNVNTVDRITGFRSFRDLNGDGKPQQSEFTVASGSLLAKALTAQSVFDAKFLLPAPPATPDFFLVPGDNQVTVIWKPSATETIGDPYFQIAGQPTTVDPVTGSVVPNPLYDPNYRQFDVEGYRIYRGRVNSPNELRLVAQFDYSGTTMPDFFGVVNPTTDCAPELGVPPAPTPACPFLPIAPGTAANPTASVTVPLTGPIIQATSRQKLSGDTSVIITGADTALTGGNSAACAPSVCPPLEDTQVPFTFVDHNVRNGFRYFYSVTAFDVNSIRSGPSSQESSRSATKDVTPNPPASNLQAAVQVALSLQGRGKVLDFTAKDPALDPASGRFAGPMAPANGFLFGLAGLAQEVLAGGAAGTFSVTLDSLQLGSSLAGTPTTYWLTGTSAAGTKTQFFLPLTQAAGEDSTTAFAYFSALPVNAAAAGRFGGNASFGLNARFDQKLAGDYYTTQYGRGCVNGATGFTSNDIGLGCEYNGSRWFDGPSPEKNETVADPNGNNPFWFIADPTSNTVHDVPVNYNNSGGLTGVAVVHEPLAYVTTTSQWREVHGLLGGAARAADYNVYWGTGGVIDSVIDVTNNVVVPFDTAMAGSWGILTQPASNVPGTADANSALTPTDIGCVYPANVDPGVQSRAGLACTAATPIKLTNRAVLGPVAELGAALNAFVPSPNPGFLLYMPGHLYMMEMAALPAPGTVWSLRTYIGAISGGKGLDGDFGPYVFTPQIRTFSAVGATLQAAVTATNQLVATTRTDLTLVHTVPDPYYVTNAFEQATEFKVLKFVNLPAQAIIRIYSSSGVLVRVIEHNGGTSGVGSEENWDLRNRNNQVVASGVYFYHIESGDARRVGRFTVVNFAQ